MTAEQACAFIATLLRTARENNEQEAVSELNHEFYGAGTVSNIISRLIRMKDAEIRLNGAGFKLYINNRSATLGGDQANLYPATTKAGRQILSQLQ